MEKPTTNLSDHDHKVSDAEVAAPKAIVLNPELAEDPDEGLSEEERAKIVSWFAGHPFWIRYRELNC